jgi:hypothetical protein
MKRNALVGRPITTAFAEQVTPLWAPLEGVALVARSRADLPSFHEGEFMYMATLFSAPDDLRLHLYKHFDTRRYLNLDVEGRAYAHLGEAAGTADPRSAGRYQRYRTLADAIDRVELWLFDLEPGFHRSFPPEEWPEDVCPPHA